MAIPVIVTILVLILALLGLLTLFVPMMAMVEIDDRGRFIASGAALSGLCWFLIWLTAKWCDPAMKSRRGGFIVLSIVAIVVALGGYAFSWTLLWVTGLVLSLYPLARIFGCGPEPL